MRHGTAPEVHAEGAATGVEIRFAKNRIGHTLAAVSTVEEIKAAIGQLPLEERAALIAELCGWADDDWDRRMKADAKSGKFAALNEDASCARRSRA